MFTKLEKKWLGGWEGGEGEVRDPGTLINRRLLRITASPPKLMLLAVLLNHSAQPHKKNKPAVCKHLEGARNTTHEGTGGGGKVVFAPAGCAPDAHSFQGTNNPIIRQDSPQTSVNGY